MSAYVYRAGRYHREDGAEPCGQGINENGTCGKAKGHRGPCITAMSLIKAVADECSSDSVRVAEPRKAAVALIQREDGRVLCAWNLRYNGFSLPGGMVEDGETTDAALRRELREETSCEVATLELIFEGEHNLRPKTGERGGRASIVALYRVTATGEPQETEPGCRVEWLTWDEFLEQSPFGAFYRAILPSGPRPSEVTLEECDNCGIIDKPLERGHCAACICPQCKRTATDCGESMAGDICSDCNGLQTNDALPVPEGWTLEQRLHRALRIVVNDALQGRLSESHNAIVHARKVLAEPPEHTAATRAADLDNPNNAAMLGLKNEDELTRALLNVLLEFGRHSDYSNNDLRDAVVAAARVVRTYEGLGEQPGRKHTVARRRHAAFIDLYNALDALPEPDRRIDSPNNDTP